MRRARALGAAVAAAGLGLACAPLLRASGPPPPGQVELVVYSGFSRPSVATGVPASRVDVLVDATSSMRRTTASGVTLFAEARKGAEETLRALPPDADVVVHALGARGGQVCGPAEVVAGPAAGASLAPVLATLAPQSEGSLVASLHEIQTRLAAEGAATRARVIVFTDLHDDCGGDLCAAAESLVAAGGWLELRLVGDAEPPACIAALRPSPSLPGRYASYFSPPPPTFRVNAVNPGDGQPSELASGRAGDGPVELAPGLVTVDVDLVPPERVGPFKVGSGERVRVRLLDFPGATPPDRAWQVERAGESFDRRIPAPPPGTTGDSIR